MIMSIGQNQYDWMNVTSVYQLFIVTINLYINKVMLRTLIIYTYSINSILTDADEKLKFELMETAKERKI